ncbi:unnamed protein product [Caenorhabditis sp. 36 PRJEB53466]|nr:unnamed protein product [Caenorhabditis sp. 36 PRJEB53466]
MCEDVTTDKQLHEPVRISIASSEPAVYTLRVKGVYDFDIRDAAVYSVASPPEPRFHRYTFPENVERVAIEVTSDTDLCGRILARQAEKSKIGPTFHLIFTVFPDDSECGTKPDLTNNGYRVKSASVKIVPTHVENTVALLPLFVYSICILIVLIATYYHSRWLDRQENNEPSIFEGSDSEGTVIVNNVQLFEAPNKLTVSHKQYEKKRVVKQSRYFNFFYFQIFGAMLPSMTTLFQNRLLRFKVLNLDACNNNFSCAFELFGFDSFNSMASASSLIFLGVVNLLLVFRKTIFRYSDDKRQTPSTHGLHQQDAPKVVCVLSMIALGVFWTITSSCPQKSTIYLYVYTIVWVCLSAMMWIYSKRHGIRKWHQTFIIVVSSILAAFTFSEKNLENSTTITFVMKTLLGLFANLATAYFCYKYCYEKPSGLQEYQWIQTPLYFGEKVLCDEKGVFQPLEV